MMNTEHNANGRTAGNAGVQENASKTEVTQEEGNSGEHESEDEVKTLDKPDEKNIHAFERYQ